MSTFSSLLLFCPIYYAFIVSASIMNGFPKNVSLILTFSLTLFERRLCLLSRLHEHKEQHFRIKKVREKKKQGKKVTLTFFGYRRDGIRQEVANLKWKIDIIIDFYSINFLFYCQKVCEIWYIFFKPLILY